APAAPSSRRTCSPPWASTPPTRSAACDCRSARPPPTTTWISPSRSCPRPSPACEAADARARRHVGRRRLVGGRRPAAGAGPRRRRGHDEALGRRQRLGLLL